MLLLMATEGQVSALQVETWEQFQNKLHNLICCGQKLGLPGTPVILWEKGGWWHCCAESLVLGLIYW